MNLHERWRPDPLSWPSHIRRSRQRRPDGDMRHRDVVVLLHRSCDGPDDACRTNLRILLAKSAAFRPAAALSGFPIRRPPMSLCLQPLPPVPDDTARIAQAAFRRGNPYVLLRDRLGAVFADTDFADLYPTLGQPAYAPWRLALVTLMPFREGLSDRQAAEAVRSRIDWKSLLALELADAGFDFSVLCEFRARLLQHRATERLLARLLDAAREGGLLKARGQQRTASTHVLAAVRDLNRLELLAETLRAALNAIAVAAPDWLHALAPLEWHERYDRRIEDMRLPLVPSVTPTPSRWA